MDRAASRGPRPGPPGSLLHGSCNYLQNVVAISYIFVLQLPTFLLCSIQIFLSLHRSISLFLVPEGSHFLFSIFSLPILISLPVLTSF